MKFQDSSFNGLKVTVGTKSVTHTPTHAPTHAPKAICPINFFKVGGIKNFRKMRVALGPPFQRGTWQALCPTEFLISINNQ